MVIAESSRYREPDHGCISLPCFRGVVEHFTRFPGKKDPWSRACLVLSSGQLVVRKENGDFLAVDVAQAMWDSGYGLYFGGTLTEWRRRFPWLALPWREAGVTVRVMVKDPLAGDVRSQGSCDVGLMFIFDDLVPRHIWDGDYGPFVMCHAAIEPSCWKGSLPVVLPFANLLLGVQYHAAMAPLRPKMIAVLLGHSRVGRDSLIGSLKPDNLRRILELAYLIPGSGSGAAIGGAIPRPDADSSLIGLNSGPQVERRDRRARPPLLRPRHWAPHLPALLMMMLIQVFAQPVPMLVQLLTRTLQIWICGWLGG